MQLMNASGQVYDEKTGAWTSPLGPHPSVQEIYAYNGRAAVAAKDPYTAQRAVAGSDYTIGDDGQVREKTWWEKHKETVKFLGEAGAAVGGGFYLSGLNGASGVVPEAASGAAPEFAQVSTPLTGVTANSVTGAVNSAAAGAGGGGGILGTASKFLGYDPNNKSKSILDIVGKIGDTLGAAGQGAAQGRIQQTELNQRQDQLAQDRYKTEITAPQQIARNSVKGDILANAQDFSYGAPTMVGNIPVPTSSGGLRPSIFSDNTRKLGTRMSADALAQPGPPPLTPMDEAGVGTSILNTAGTIGSFADLFNPELYKSKIPYTRPRQGQVA